MTQAAVAAQAGMSLKQLRHRAHRQGWPRHQPRRPQPKLPTIRERYRRLIEQKIEQMEKRMTSGEETSPADNERHARELSTLIRNGEKLKSIEEASATAGSGAPANGGKAPYDYSDAEHWRAAIAERIERMLQRSRTSG